MIAEPTTLIPRTMRANAVVVDELIGWLRSATPANVMDEAARKLAAGIDEDDLWAAAVLTACHYTNNQAHNLMGFLAHAMVGCEDARHLAVGQSRRIRYLLLLQTLHQTVDDMHNPFFAPYELLPSWPIHEATVDANIEGLRRDVRMGEYLHADHRLLGLNEHLTPAQIADLVLDIGLEGMVTDDHCLISPTLSLGMMELVGWERGFGLMRWAVRYSSSFPINFAAYDRSIEFLRHYKIEAGAPARALQPERVQELRRQFLMAEPAARPEMVARLLAHEAVAPATIAAAAAQAACDMYLMIDPVPHSDFDAISREVAPIHLGNCLRLLTDALAYMTPRTQALAALQAGSMLERGPAVLDADFVFVPFQPVRSYPYAEDVASLAQHQADDLLEHLRLVAPEHDCRQVTAAVRAYANRGADPEQMIALLTELAATDHGTLLHNFKHLNSMVIEFRRSDHPDRWNFLIQGAKFLTWYCGLTTHAFAQADAALKEHLRL